jgi:TetR/AcrR family transcriptional regulator
VTTRSAASKSRAAKRGAPRTPTPATREVILDTAEQLFASHGVDGVALRDLARTMDLTAPSLYNHFPSKQALYEAVLERGLRPIMETIGAAWHPGALQPDQMRATVDRMISHLATHPHLARLLQRALLDESSNVQKLIARWLAPLYLEGIAVIRETADGAGWEAEDVPYLALGLFGMMFAYFINAAALQHFTGRGGDPLSPRALAGQRRFLEKAVYRLLGPTAADGDRRLAQRL